MKKTLLSCALALTSVSMFAAQTLPVVYEENFVEMSKLGDYLSPDWVTYGNGATPSGVMANFFSDGNGGYVNFVILNYGMQAIPMCCTNFTPSTAADQWMVSPEIEIPSDSMVLGFTAAVYGNKGQWGTGDNTFKVMISDSGVTKDDFKEVVYEGAMRSTNTKEIALTSFYCPIKGYNGKKVHLAFIGTGNDCGMLGFTDITVGNYAITVSNETPEMVQKGEEVSIAYNLGLKTAVDCPGLTAVLTTDDGTVEKTYKKQFGSSSTSLVYQKVEFDPIKLENTGTLNYTVTVTPEYEGAPSSVLSGSVGVPDISYLNNSLVEEVTATGCQACPAGMAAMEYYADNYKGSETEGKVIGIAIHGYINHTDPMSEGVSDYLTSTMDLNATTVYPQAIYNRATRGMMPGTLQADKAVAAQLTLPSYTKVEITDVVLPTDMDNFWSKPMTVKYQVKSAYDAQSRNLNASMVLVEDNVKGSEPNYSQTNGFYNRSADYFKNNYDPAILPYAEKYLQGGELGQSEISYEKMTYNHVARLLYPSYVGEVLNTEWERDTYQQYEFSFKVPETVIDLKNCKVVLIVTDGVTYEVLASDEKSVCANSGVDEISADSSISVEKTGAQIVVSANGALTADVYSTSGVKLASANGNGSVALDCAMAQGVVIVKVTTANGTLVKKLAF